MSSERVRCADPDQASGCGGKRDEDGPSGLYSKDTDRT